MYTHTNGSVNHYVRIWLGFRNRTVQQQSDVKQTACGKRVKLRESYLRTALSPAQCNKTQQLTQCPAGAMHSGRPSRAERDGGCPRWRWKLSVKERKEEGVTFIRSVNTTAQPHCQTLCFRPVELWIIPPSTHLSLNMSSSPSLSLYL